MSAADDCPIIPQVDPGDFPRLAGNAITATATAGAFLLCPVLLSYGVCLAGEEVWLRKSGCWPGSLQ
ncbi:hypothetical protein CEXT_333771 [Caerostris extrusa]|uniref:Uncharacterized protein n=1 Tax=Caerostris extrusa TaxID=172846 RepID=A0AAV4TU72_CAEEX|nr:hypothetical protein CEXT_333771 [Caerostris extrusa]